MSSGYGIKGGIGRCYPFFAQLKECVAEKELSATGIVCQAKREDYFECLHHTKEHNHVRQVAEQHALNKNAPVETSAH
jgi:NADH dehydrogenase (ubiquinone) Fe-S protein 5